MSLAGHGVDLIGRHFPQPPADPVSPITGVGLVNGPQQVAAAMSGVLIPLSLKAFKVDPALASSIFLTTVTDVAGFFFFLGLAALALRWSGM